ncbi:hypothetical protein DF157_08590 [Burkholderia cenocepacia]|nr:hypothetical protein DF157_08590 [Burkholderia cenocepacia]RQV43888.1 hypothetical protein DF028_08830 [Burkholderia cenocepacia]RQV46952.1 hypothetical protein DF027_10600 [Burkholderia cenocepacia]RQV76806.1 hypothetical protein DF010_16955 [Burkholderia cenocepacia]
MSSPSSLHAQRSTGAGAAAPARFRVARRTVTSLRAAFAAFAALPSCLSRVPVSCACLVCLLVRPFVRLRDAGSAHVAAHSCRAITIRCTSLVPS